MSTGSRSLSDPSLGDLLADLLDEAGDVEVLAEREYGRHGVAFAARTAEEEIELRLNEDIAEAALRTPATSPSSRGSTWVRLAPPEWDAHAVDRLRAWFLSAYRLAGAKK